MSGTISVKLITSANPGGVELTTGNASATIAASTNDASTIIEATFTGTGKTDESEELTKATIDASFDAYGIDNTSIGNRTLKVKVVNYNDIFNAFSTMDESSKLNIVDLSGMVVNNSLSQGQTQGLDGGAFDGCENLREITLFSNCAEIEGYAFFNCSSLKKVYQIPSKLTNVDSTAFDGANANALSIFNIALGITERGVVNAAANIVYDPVERKTETNVVEYDVTATATLNSNNIYQASKIFSETSQVSNSAPTFASNPLTSATEDSKYTYTAVATDVNSGDTVTLSETTIPSWLTFTSSTGELTGTPSNENVGTTGNNVVLRATDSKGASAVQSFTIVVANTNDAPTFTSIAIGNATEDSVYSYTAVATDVDGGDTVTLSGTTIPSWLTFDATTGVLTGTPSNGDVGSSSNNRVVLTATDSNGATATQEFTIVVTNVNDAPVFDPSESTAIAFEDNEFSYDVPAASDVDSGDTLTYTKQSGPNWVSFDATTGKLTGTPKNSDVGTTGNTVVIRATDLSGSQDDFTLEIEVGNTPDAPVFDPSVGTTTAVEDSEFSYMVKATDDDSDDTLTYTKQSGPTWVSVNPTTGELTGTPLNANVGSDNIVVIRATDESRTYAEFTLTINVTNTNDIPTFTSTAVTTGKTGLLYTYAIETSDDDGDSVTVSTRTVPTWLSLTGNVLSGTPGINDKGDHDVVLRAADSYGTYATQSFTISVSQFKPADKDELQTAIDKWYDLANFSTTTTSTSETNTSDTTGEVSEKTKFYINDINSTPIEIDIDGELSFSSFNDVQGIKQENLVKVEIGTKVTSIYKQAFLECSALQSLTIPDSVTSIGDNAIRDCSKLKSVTIPDGVTSIGVYAFSACQALTSVTIGNQIETISTGAFFKCQVLNSVTFNETSKVQTISGQAFQNCDALQSLTIPDSVTTIADNAFVDNGLTTLYMTSKNGLSITKSEEKSIGAKTVNVVLTDLTRFYIDTIDSAPIELDIRGQLLTSSYENKQSITKSNLVKVEIGTNVDQLGGELFIKGGSAFRGCIALQSVTIPDSVTSIGGYTFYECGELQNVTIGNSVETTGEGVFGRCFKLQTIKIPDSVTSIKPTTFNQCSALQSVTIGNSVTSIDRGAFYDSGLTTITIPESVTSIGKEAFRFCGALKSVTITDCVTSIGESAFKDNDELQSVSIGDSVESIGNNAFELCRALQSLTIPDSVTSIGEAAFNKSGLTTIYVTSNNGLQLEGGSDKVIGGKNVNVEFIFLEKIANNYDGPEYYGNPNAWDVSLISDLSYVFYKKDQNNHPDISTWNVSNVTTMQGTFSNSTFNQALINWNVASVTDFSFTFANNVVFNKSLKRWNVQDATTMESMFDNAYSFNQTIEPPMVQNKNGTDFPTQLTWDENTINGYLETIYGDATPQTNPTTFKGVFGMIALLKKTYLDALNGNTYKTIKLSFSEVMSELITNQQEILEYNYTYDRDEDTWTKTDPSIYFANTNSKTGNDLNEAKDSLNQLRLNTIVDGMLLINKAYDIAKGLGADYSDLINGMNSIYDNVYTELPFYISWYAPLLTTKANFLNNAFTFHNGATTDSNGEKARIDQKLTDFIDTNPIKGINCNDYSSTDKQTNVQSSSSDLYENFKNKYTE